MDLLEVQSLGARHPWELARARAIERIVRRFGPASVGSILDWGCGDAFTGRRLLDRLGAARLVGMDPHLTPAQRDEFCGADPRITLHTKAVQLPDERFDLVLLCDVIEHVADDEGLVSMIARRFLRSGGRIIVTVPAFQALFSAHDVALKHFRRYRLAELESTVRRSGLVTSASGYLFGSLLPLRALGKLLGFGVRPRPDEPVGLGSWRGGTVLTSLVASSLVIDNSVLLSLAERGMKLPGLSAWASCEARAL